MFHINERFTEAFDLESIIEINLPSTAQFSTMLLPFIIACYPYQPKCLGG